MSGGDLLQVAKMLQRRDKTVSDRQCAVPGSDSLATAAEAHLCNVTPSLLLLEHLKAVDAQESFVHHMHHKLVQKAEWLRQGLSLMNANAWEPLRHVYCSSSGPTAGLEGSLARLEELQERGGIAACQ